MPSPSSSSSSSSFFFSLSGLYQRLPMGDEQIVERIAAFPDCPRKSASTTAKWRFFNPLSAFLRQSIVTRAPFFPPPPLLFAHFLSFFFVSFFVFLPSLLSRGVFASTHTQQLFLSPSCPWNLISDRLVTTINRAPSRGSPNDGIELSAR